MSNIRIHPKSLPITSGWSQIGPRPRHFKAITKRVLSEAFRTTLSRQESRRMRKLRHKIAAGKLTETDAVIGIIDAQLMPRPPRQFVVKNGVSHAA